MPALTIDPQDSSWVPYDLNPREVHEDAWRDACAEANELLRREHAHRVWNCLHALVCVMNAFEAGGCDGYGAHMPPGWVDALRIDYRDGYAPRR